MRLSSPRYLIIAASVFVIGCQNSQQSESENSDLSAEVGTHESEDARIERIREGANRATENAHQRASGDSEGATAEGGVPQRWIVNLSFSACPSAEDWFDFQDAVMNGATNVNLPSRCRILDPGMTILAPVEGQRATAEHDGHIYERGRFENGTEFWTDGMDHLSLSRR